MNYVQGVLEGNKILYNDDHILVEQVSYHQGLFHGPVHLRSPSGEVLKGVYQEGKKHGFFELFIEHPETKELHKMQEYACVNHKMEGEAKEFYPTGQIKMASELKQGVLNGPLVVYSEQGKPTLITSFVDGVETGEHKEFYPTGKLFRVVSMNQNEKNGLEKSYYETGQLMSEIPYKAHKIHGVYKEWNKQGVLIFEASYDQGLRHGKFAKYYDDGKPKLIQTFVQDLPHGDKKTFDSNGKLTTVSFDKGKKKG
jgi:antitoxin component YwqK of YwqJK toxin-antitoxin module